MIKINNIVLKFIKSAEYISDIISEWETLNKNENSVIYNELKMNPQFSENNNALNQCKNDFILYF